ncbi:MAG: hypothetical protein IKU34_07565 [Clostridia bacterium]|nr:hypothetical protein [Clostridia bacterium]
MAHVRSLFPAATGPEGLISCFDHLISDDCLRRKLILKGGPGVGKSTFMRRIHAALGSDTQSTLYFCSGDPDSLDAVAFPDRGLLILDGTAPHIIDPQIPGARDSLINLGECLNEKALRPRLSQIRSVMAEHAACLSRARACLCAALPMIRNNARIISDAADDGRLRRLTHALITAVLSGTPAQAAPHAAVRPVITDAVTAKGELCLLAEGEQQRVIRLTGHDSTDFTPVLRALSRAAQASSLAVEEHLSPRLPGGLLHVSIPALHTLITTSARLPSEMTFDLASCIPQGNLLRRECMLEQGRASISLHISRAVAALAAAKEVHDELESFYVPNMDFSAWQKRLDETLDSLC